MRALEATLGVLGGTWVVVWSSLERPWGCLGSSWGPLGSTWGFLCGLLATQSLKYVIKTNGFSSILKSILSNFCMLFGTQKRPKSSPGAPRGRPRDARGCPRSLQGSPKRHPRHPRGAPGDPKVPQGTPTRVLEEHPWDSKAPQGPTRTLFDPQGTEK